MIEAEKSNINYNLLNNPLISRYIDAFKCRFFLFYIKI